jgi:hypothetical protein
MRPLFELGPFLCDDLLDHTRSQCEYEDVKSKIYLIEIHNMGRILVNMTWAFWVLG